ncbi:MAG: acetyltransferase [bacterium]|nr:acetyltransferase [bacterium]
MHYIDLFPKSEDLIREHREKMLGEQPYIHPTSRVYDSHVGVYTEIGPNCTLVESTFGDYSYTAGDADIIYTDIGKFCSIASHTRINPGNHPMERVTQHHMTYRRKQYGFAETDDDTIFDWRRSHRCVIGHDIWLGHGVTVMPGVEIGIGAVVGSGAVVTKNVQPYEIVVGIPARPIRKRFSDDIIEKLLAIAWWDWDRARLEAHFHELNDVEAFIARHG